MFEKKKKNPSSLSAGIVITLACISWLWFKSIHLSPLSLCAPNAFRHFGAERDPAGPLTSHRNPCQRPAFSAFHCSFAGWCTHRCATDNPQVDLTSFIMPRLGHIGIITWPKLGFRVTDLTTLLKHAHPESHYFFNISVNEGLRLWKTNFFVWLK